MSNDDKFLNSLENRLIRIEGKIDNLYYFKAQFVGVIITVSFLFTAAWNIFAMYLKK